jgi:hypothetical protein
LIRAFWSFHIFGITDSSLSENPDATGTLVEIEEHKKNEKVVIALE